MRVRKKLVPTDFEQTSGLALVYARDLARLFGATLQVVHVIQDEFALAGGTEGSVATLPRLRRELEECATARINELLTEQDRAAGVTSAVLLSSLPADAIVEHARTSGADLIVMGTHGRGGVSPHVIGSVAERVVRVAPCPVLTVRPPEEAVLRMTTTLRSH
jgi:nucleotide-binding universal stress UspA family protein